MIQRLLAPHIQAALEQYPAVAILGPRQVGKTTLALHQLQNEKQAPIYLDLERPSDWTRLSDPEYFLSNYKDRLVIIDEVQRMMTLFPILRALIDEQRTPGRFLLLGSASDLLISQSSESLAGRISYKELHPFSMAEIAPAVHGGWRVGAYRIRGNRACLRLPSVAEHQTRMGRIMDNCVGRHALSSYSGDQRLHLY